MVTGNLVSLPLFEHVDFLGKLLQIYSALQIYLQKERRLRMLGIEAEDEEYYQSADAIVERYVSAVLGVFVDCSMERLLVIRMISIAEVTADKGKNEVMFAWVFSYQKGGTCEDCMI